MTTATARRTRRELGELLSLAVDYAALESRIASKAREFERADLLGELNGLELCERISGAIDDLNSQIEQDDAS